MAELRHLYLIAGEPSGDRLGAGLIRALRAERPGLRVSGVGGPGMEAEGLRSLFPLSDIAVMGIGAVLARLPSIVRRVHEAVADVVRTRPDALVIVDSPEFTHAVARRVRRRLPGLPIVNYVSPSVWAWRPRRAPRMRAYVDHVLALKPFEPAAHLRLGGPPCTYVGHPLVEELAELRPAPGERAPLEQGPLRLLVLPGSRRSEITRLAEPFGAALARFAAAAGRELDVALPAVPHLADAVRDLVGPWAVQPRIVLGEDAKRAEFRAGHLALAASGTVTLELALAGVPLVAAYRVARWEEPLRFLITVPSVVLANLVLGENVVPERLQWDCTPEKLAEALLPLAADTPERRRQTEAFGRLDAVMEAGHPVTPSARAAGIVLAVAERR